MQYIDTKFSDLYKAVPFDQTFKLGTWDCYIFANWIRNYYGLKSLPKAKYNQPVLDQLKVLLKETESLDCFNALSIRDPNTNRDCLGTLLKYRIPNSKQIVTLVAYMDFNCQFSDLESIKITGNFKYD
jgi:hypothetical protein